MKQNKSSIKVRVERKSDFTKVYINDILHFQFKTEELYALQSWKEGKELHYIRYYLKCGVINCYYYNEPLWKEILDGLNKISLVG